MVKRALPRVVTFALLAACASSPAEPYDLLIEGGLVVDGSGAPGRHADVGVAGGSIRAIGQLSGAAALRTIDASGLVVAPGFIDVHTHVDDAFDDPETAGIENYVIQGVTTVRPGADGSSSHRVAELKARWEANGMGANAALTVGFNTLREEFVEGDGQRPASPAEIEAMQAAVHQGMQEGAWGISSGLEYDGFNVHASTAEVIAVTRPVAAYDGFYISHMRDEAAHFVEAVDELIHIAEKAGVRACVTHIKAAGKISWGTMPAAIAHIQEARDRGLDICADQYPFDQGAPIDFITGLIDVPRDMAPFDALPRGARAEYVTALQTALRDPKQRARLRASTYEPRESDPSPAARWGWQDFAIRVAVDNAELVGRNLALLAEERGQDGFDLVAELVLSEPDILFASASMSAADVEHAMVQPWVMHSSDGEGFGPVPADARPVRDHPRSFASQAIVLRKYVREDGLLSLEEAVRKLSALPAELIGLPDRGRVEVGWVADLALFDPERVQDLATYDDARRYATGVEYVLVGGELAVDAGELTGARPGVVLLRR